ncbi:hypothetical protein ACWERI_37270 [Streptomyces collinus]
MSRKRPPIRRKKRPGKRQQERDARMLSLLVAAGVVVMVIR